jgi:hypothetical protein
MYGKREAFRCSPFAARLFQFLSLHIPVIFLMRSIPGQDGAGNKKTPQLAGLNFFW